MHYNKVLTTLEVCLQCTMLQGVIGNVSIIWASFMIWIETAILYITFFPLYITFINYLIKLLVVKYYVTTQQCCLYLETGW